MNEQDSEWIVTDRRGLVVWAAVVVVILLLGIGSLALIREVERGPRPPFLGAEPEVTQPPPAPESSDTRLHVAGSGSNLPLTRALATAFASRERGTRIIVHESIGSSGGVRAVSDGAIDVGLISRELKPQERPEDLRVIPYARVAVVFAAHPQVPVDGIDTEQVLALYSGRQSRWPDGTDAVVLLREPGDSAHVIAGREIPGFADVDAGANEEGRWRTVFYDREMQDSLMATDGAIGLFDLGAAVAQSLPIKVLELDGVAATESNIEAGRYPLHKPLSFVVRGEGSVLARRFIAFVHSVEGARIIRELGYIPVHEASAMPEGGGE